MSKMVTVLAVVCLVGLVLISMVHPVLASPQAQLTVFPTPTPGPDGRIIYIVQEGDTLWRISAITGVSVDQIRSLNNLLDDTVRPGDQLLIGLAGPVQITPTEGPSPTAGPALPTPTPGKGWGIICVILYNDLNGDSTRQENEPSIPGGAISISDRLGRVSLTAETPAGGVSDVAETPEDLGYTCFEELPEAEYNVTVAIPEGYNATTIVNLPINLKAGDETFLTFGAQPNSETVATTAIVPETPGRSPLLGILGGALLVIGLGMGVYATLLRRRG
jgi:murein DD-endopeptidase MepM/ murein hydrolase activator NlpD